jgi:uncharacterized protein with HEPN domain
MRRERLYLEDIIDSIEKIQSFTAEMDFNSFRGKAGTATFIDPHQR